MALCILESVLLVYHTSSHYTLTSAMQKQGAKYFQTKRCLGEDPFAMYFEMYFVVAFQN